MPREEWDTYRARMNAERESELREAAIERWGPDIKKCRFMSVRELANILCVSTRTILRAIDSGKLKCVRLGLGIIRISEWQFAEWLVRDTKNVSDAMSAETPNEAKTVAGSAAIAQARCNRMTEKIEGAIATVEALLQKRAQAQTDGVKTEPLQANVADASQKGDD